MPDALSPIVPHLIVAGGAAAIEFYKKAFGAEEVFRLPGPQGKIMHASLRIGGGTLMLVDDMPEMCGGQSRAPGALGGTPVTIHLNVADVDAAWKKAVAAGATVEMPLADMFWGDRYGVLKDPFGHSWSMSTHRRDVSPEEIKAAMEALSKKQ
jgi:PhnB protein